MSHLAGQSHANVNKMFENIQNKTSYLRLGRLLNVLICLIYVAWKLKALSLIQNNLHFISIKFNFCRKLEPNTICKHKL